MHTLAWLYGEPYAKLDDEIALISEALTRKGIALKTVGQQTKAKELRSYDAICLQACSGYHHNLPAFLKAIENLEGIGIPIFNSPTLVRWNSDKRYLRELEKASHAVLPTLWSDQTGHASLKELLTQENWKDAVVKPVVSAGAHETRRIMLENTSQHEEWFTKLRLALAQKGEALMIQAFAPEIVQEGEWSLMFFGGEFSHAVLKTAKSGDYRIQHVHGGLYQHTAPPANLLKDAEALIAALPEPALYARVDGIQRNGRLVLMEIELIEPFFYLLPEKHLAENFASACAEALEKRLAA